MDNNEGPVAPIVTLRDGLRALVHVGPDWAAVVAVLVVGGGLALIGGPLDLSTVCAMIAAVWVSKTFSLKDPALWKVAPLVWLAAIGVGAVLTAVLSVLGLAA